MTTISKSMLLPYSAAEMYALVNDIESYPKFLPWCREARVHEQTEDEIRATIELSKGGIQKAFTTCNRIQKDKMIEIRLLEGPFRHLNGYWRFDALRADACKVSMDIEFEFANRMLALVIGPVFSQIVSSLVDAFRQRAEEVYGRR